VKGKARKTEKKRKELFRKSFAFLAVNQKLPTFAVDFS
jgi:hypothetical protein